MKLYLRKLSSD